MLNLFLKCLEQCLLKDDSEKQLLTKSKFARPHAIQKTNKGGKCSAASFQFLFCKFILECASFFMGVTKLNAQRSGMPRRCVPLQISGTNPLIKALSLPKRWTGRASAQLSTINNVVVTSTRPSSVIPHDDPLKNGSRAVRKLSKSLSIYVFPYLSPLMFLKLISAQGFHFRLFLFCISKVTDWCSMYLRASREKVYKGKQATYNNTEIEFTSKSNPDLSNIDTFKNK